MVMQLEVRKRLECVETDPVIEVSNLDVFYGEKQALKDVNIKIFKNQITAFIGPSGCGKTTLLRCFNRMNDMIKTFRMEGEILLDCEDIYTSDHDVIALRKKVGMVFQQPNPLPTSIYNNLSLPIKEHFPKITKEDLMNVINKKLSAAHLLSEIENRIHESALKLSGGQQQRLCIARALTIEPEVILFDEPCSALDPISTMKIEELLMRFKEKYTIIIVTHNMQQATRIADKVAFFFQGEIIEQGTADDLFVNPQQELTQRYVTGRF
ncbi:MAG: phosphate ABC transporter ATP-binding protein [Hyphomonadaceae bacterium]|nr:phosphate ABC transporter ATP-binding protein [Clostridia bacterium]